MARELEKRVLPIRIEDCATPPFFDGYDIVDLHSPAAILRSLTAALSPGGDLARADKLALALEGAAPEDAKAMVRGVVDLIRAQPSAAEMVQAAATTVIGEAKLVITGGIQNLTVNFGGGPPANPLLERYRRELAAEFVTIKSFINLGDSGPDARGGAAKAPRLAEVYVDLEVKVLKWVETGDPHRHRERDDNPDPVNILAAVAENRHCVILGDPGSGKSTFVRHFCGLLASSGKHAEKLAAWSKSDQQLLPIPVFIRELAKWAGEAKVRAEGDDLALWRFLEHRWSEKRELTGMGEALRKAFEEGQAILLFDGLDEAPSEGRRRDWVASLIRALAGREDCQSRVVVTSRGRNYQRDDSQVLDEEAFPTLRIQDLDDGQVKSFVHGSINRPARSPGMECGGLTPLSGEP